MKILIAIFFLFSFNSLIAAEDDVYFCIEEHRIGYFPDDDDNTFVKYQLEKYKFKRTSNMLIFNNSNGFFDDYELDLTYSSGEIFHAGNEGLDVLKYSDGKYYYSMVSSDGILSIAGTCTIF